MSGENFVAACGRTAAITDVNSCKDAMKLLSYGANQRNAHVFEVTATAGNDHHPVT